ncbi:PadR family transcriptional regulator [bacterium]|nr:MAG: PadR family transcriptional regulator [bacterium]
MGKIFLGLFELSVLACTSAMNKPYGVQIVKYIEESLGKKVSKGAMYTTLQRLKNKGYLSTEKSKITHKRGGRRRIMYCITDEGKRVLHENMQTMTDLFSALIRDSQKGAQLNLFDEKESIQGDSQSNIWTPFQGEGYQLVDLGRAAQFLLPSHKLQTELGESTVEKDLERFMFDNFGAFSATTLPTAGFWRNNQQKIVYDECRRYEVSFVGKQKIPVLLKKLADIAKHIKEDCIYFQAGQYNCLIFPKE